MLRIIILAKRRTKRDCQRTRNPADKRVYNQLCRQVKDGLSAHRSDQWDRKLAEVTDPNEIWKVSGTVTRSITLVPAIHEFRGVAYSSEDKAETIAESLEDQILPNRESSDDVFGDVARR